MSNNPNSPTLWTAVIGILGLIIGASGGYLGTKVNAQAQIQSAQESAKAQITAAAINVYGPIFATQTAEARIAPAMTSVPPGKDETLAIEAVPQNVFVYAGNDGPDGGRGTFSLTHDNEHALSYGMDYSLPKDKYGYAGMVFQFPKGYNFSVYKTIKFTITFKVPSDEVDLFVKDISGNNNSIRIVGNGKNEMDLSYEFTNFQDINFNAVKEIGVFASTEFSTGSHAVWIKNVRFAK